MKENGAALSHKCNVQEQRVAIGARRGIEVMASAHTALGMAFGLGLVLTSPAAFARQADPGRTEPLQALLQCRTITDAAARLRCLDARTAEVEVLLNKGDLVVATRTRIVEAQAAQFGRSAPAPAIAMREQEQAPPPPTRIDTSIKGVSTTPDGKWIMVLADGARWQQIDGRTLARDPKPGMAIAIRRAAMGSYLANVAGQPAMRVRRVN